MDIRIEFAGEKAVCRQSGKEAFSTTIREFYSELLKRKEQTPLPGNKGQMELIPEGVRFIRLQDDVVVLVMEEKPCGVRTVQWLAEDSPAPFGPKAVYRAARLAFPFVVLIIAFRGGELSGQQQCFYRNAPLKGLDDSLLLPNLYNVSVDAYGQKAWLCLKPLKNRLKALSWQEKVTAIRKELWSKFNRSSEEHEGASYWGTMRVDPRVSSIEAWERASQEDPFFPLKVRWRPARRTVGQVVEEMLSELSSPFLPSSAEEMAQVFYSCPGSVVTRRKRLVSLIEALKNLE